MTLAPIIVFVYNRPWHTRQTIEALLKNELAAESDLFIFSDGPKDGANPDQIAKIQEVREYIHSIIGFKSIHIEESAKNKGLANSIISGVTNVIANYGKAIVFEDDLITQKYCLRFINDALNFYEDDFRIFSIGATNYNIEIPESYKHDIYLAHRSESCGWGTWKDRWDLVDWEVFDYDSFSSDARSIRKFNRGGDDMAPMLRNQMEGKIDSWAIRWDYCMYKNDAYCLRPIKTLIKNTGFDGSGIHSGDTLPEGYYSEYYNDKKYHIQLVKKINADKTIENNFKKFQCLIPQVSFFTIIKRFIKKILRQLGLLK